MRLSFLLSTAILAALAITAASAQTSVDRTFEAGGEDCRDVEWSQDVLREYRSSVPRARASNIGLARPM